LFCSTDGTGDGCGLPPPLDPFVVRCLSRNEDHLGRLIAQRGSVEIAVQFFHFEPDPFKEVFDFAPKEVPEGEALHEPLCLACGVREVVDDLDIVVLLRGVRRSDAVAAAHSPTVRQLKFGGKSSVSLIRRGSVIFRRLTGKQSKGGNGDWLVFCLSKRCLVSFLLVSLPCEDRSPQG
jgi:hypothetical protein